MDSIEKLERLKQDITIKFSPPLPCTTQDCLNEATVGNASYDHVEQCWYLVALCKECTQKLVEMYP
jgi:hypothetical protein